MENEVLFRELLQPGKSIQFEVDDGNGGKIAYRSTIYSYEENLLSLLKPKDDFVLNNIQPGTKIFIILRNNQEQNDYVFSAEFIKAESGVPLLFIKKPADLELKIGRHFFRCEVNLPLSGFLSQEKFRGEVKNLSMNGLYALVNPNLHIEPGQHITCQMNFPTAKEAVLFVAKVVRVIKKEGSQGIGLSFQHLSKNIQDQITKYLFDRQRSLINLGQIRIVKAE